MFGLEDELYNKIDKLKSENTEIKVLLKEVCDWIENSEHWWMDCPNKGGFYNEKIKQVLNKYHEIAN